MVSLPAYYNWKGYDLLKDSDGILQYRHHDIGIEVHERGEVKTALIKTSVAFSNGEGRTEAEALADALRNLKSELKKIIDNGKKAERHLDRLKRMF